MRKKVGRPRLLPDQKRVHVAVYLLKRTRRALRAQAAAEGIPLSTFLSRARERLVVGYVEPAVKTSNARREESYFVYFVQQNGADPSSPIKIGRSTDPEKRFKQYLGGPHLPLLLGVISSRDPRLERRLHKEFAAARLGGEWFSPVPALLAYIKAHARRSDGETRDQVQAQFLGDVADEEDAS